MALAYFGEDIGAMTALADRAVTLNPSFARGWYTCMTRTTRSGATFGIGASVIPMESDEVARSDRREGSVGKFGRKWVSTLAGHIPRKVL